MSYKAEIQSRQAHVGSWISAQNRGLVFFRPDS